MDAQYVEPEVWQRIALYGGGDSLGAVNKELRRLVANIQEMAYTITYGIRALVTGKKIRREIWYTGLRDRRPGDDPRQWTDQFLTTSVYNTMNYHMRTDRGIRHYRRTSGDPFNPNTGLY